MEPQWDRSSVLAQIERNVKRICDTPAANAPPNPPVASTSAFRCAPAAAAADHPLSAAHSAPRHYARGSAGALRYARSARWPNVPSDAGDGEGGAPLHISEDVCALVDVLVVGTRLPAAAARKLTLSNADYAPERLERHFGWPVCTRATLVLHESGGGGGGGGTGGV